MNSLQQELETIDRTITNAHKLRDALQQLHAVFSELPSLRYCYFYPSDATIIAGIKDRADFAKIRALHVGVWSKDTHDDSDAFGETLATMRYYATVGGILIDCRVNELPPSCHVVEERVEVPAHTKIIQRVVCNEPAKEHAEKGQVVGVREEAAV